MFVLRSLICNQKMCSTPKDFKSFFGLKVSFSTFPVVRRYSELKKYSMQDCAEEIRNCPRERFCDLTSFFFFEILTKNSVWKSAFSTYVYITSRNWFSLKNNGKNEQLLLKTFISKSIFRDFLLVKLGSFTTRALLKNRLTKKCLY